MNAQEAVRLALANHTIIPAFNIPYLPMVEPVVRAMALGACSGGCRCKNHRVARFC